MKSPVLMASTGAKQQELSNVFANVKNLEKTRNGLTIIGRWVGMIGILEIEFADAFDSRNVFSETQFGC